MSESPVEGYMVKQPKTVRAKLHLSEVHDLAGWGGAKRLKFSSQYDDTIPEDLRFQQATPSASAEFLIDNPSALAMFEIGKTYYVDFTPAG